MMDGRPMAAVHRDSRWRVRTATLADIDQMHRIRMSVRENALHDPRSIQHHHYVTMLNERGQSWVAQVQDQIVGFAVADLPLSSVWALFVDPAFEGRGVGRHLHDTMMAWFFDRGVTVVRLSTTPATRAERLYLKAGWKFVGRNPDGEVCYELRKEDWTRLAEESPNKPAL